MLYDFICYTIGSAGLLIAEVLHALTQHSSIRHLSKEVRLVRSISRRRVQHERIPQVIAVALLKGVVPCNISAAGRCTAESGFHEAMKCLVRMRSIAAGSAVTVPLPGSRRASMRTPPVDLPTIVQCSSLGRDGSNA